MILLEELTTGSWVSYYEGMIPLYEKVTLLSMAGVGFGVPIKYDHDEFLYQRIVPFAYLQPIPMTQYLNSTKSLFTQAENKDEEIWHLQHNEKIFFSIQEKDDSLVLVKNGKQLGEPFRYIHEFQRMSFSYLQFDFPIEL